MTGTQTVNTCLNNELRHIISNLLQVFIGMSTSTYLTYDLGQNIKNTGHLWNAYAIHTLHDLLRNTLTVYDTSSLMQFLVYSICTYYNNY